MRGRPRSPTCTRRWSGRTSTSSRTCRRRACVVENGRAIASRRTRLGEGHEFRANREVILCGGAYNSPQLLMLSGIGPAEHLTMREIEVVLDQPAVGENLIDHPAVSFVYTGPEEASLLLALEPEALEEFELHQTGPLPRTSPSRAGSCASTTAPPRPRSSSTRCRCRSSTRASPTRPSTACGCRRACCSRESRGSVQLASNDPTAKPIIRHNYFAAEEDMATMIKGCRVLHGHRLAAGAAGVRAARRSRCPTATPTTRCAPTSRGTRRRSTTRSARARSARWSTPTCACRASRRCASSTRRSCRWSRAATRTRR